MRYQGKITSWKDERGFGFVVQNGGGGRAFVHIKAFSNRSRRPVEGDLISYELSTDGTRGCCAENVRFVGEPATSTTASRTGRGGLVFAGLFCFVLVSASVLGRLPLAVLDLYLAASVVAFLAYLIDKSAARNDRWRTKESTLHFIALIGGWPGALFAQRALRHKSKKQEFQTVFWATVVLNCCVLGWLFTQRGSDFVHSIIELLA